VHIKKNGDAPIPRVAWKMAAEAHLEACTTLQKLIEQFNSRVRSSHGLFD